MWNVFIQWIFRVVGQLFYLCWFLSAQVIDKLLDNKNRNVQKCTFWHVRPTKTQISLRIRAVCSESSLSAWRNLVSLAIQNTPSEGSDQTAWMRRLIWIFTGCICSKLRCRTLRFIRFWRLQTSVREPVSRKWPVIMITDAIIITGELVIITLTRVLQKVLSLGSDYFSATFIKHNFISNLQSIPPLYWNTFFVAFLPSREKQINSLLLVSVGDTDK